MASDERNADPVLVHYLEQVDKALAKAGGTLPVQLREEFLRIAAQWLLLAEEYINKFS